MLISIDMGQRGFTFIEAIFMMVIVGFGCVGLMLAFTTSIRQTGDANMTITAAFLAQEQLDHMIADKIYKGYHFIVPNNYPSPQAVAAPFNKYIRSITIREVQSNDLNTNLQGSGLKRIDIDVQWGMGINQHVQLTTLVTNYL